MRTDGYVVRESVFSKEECQTAIEACEDLIDKLTKDRNAKRYHLGSYTFEPNMLEGVIIKWEGDSDVVHGIEPAAHLSPFINDFAYDPRFIEPSKAFIDDENPVLWTEKINMKRPLVGGVNPFHQDYPYWKTDADDATRIVTAMLFLDDASLINGTLQVIPGSHTSGQAPTWSDHDAFGNNEIDFTKLPTTDTVALEVPAGSVVWFGPFLVHKSEQNTSDRERRSLLYSYQPQGLTHVRELPNNPFKGKRKKDA